MRTTINLYYVNLQQKFPDKKPGCFIAYINFTDSVKWWCCRAELPAHTVVGVAGNPLSCHCSSAWLGRCGRCDHAPYILPLFPANITLSTGNN